MKKFFLSIILFFGLVSAAFSQVPPPWVLPPATSGSGSGDMTEAAYSTGGIIKNSKGGTGQNSSASTGFPSVAAGTWSFLTVAQTRTALGLGAGNTAGLPATCTAGNQYYDSQAAIKYECTATDTWTATYSVGSDTHYAVGALKNSGSGSTAYTCAAGTTTGLLNWDTAGNLYSCYNGTNSTVYSLGSDTHYAAGALKNTGSYSCAADSTKGLWNWDVNGVPSSCYNSVNTAPVMTGGSGASLTGFTNSQIPAPLTTVGTSRTVADNAEYVICTSTCTVTPKTPAAGVQLCVRNGPGVVTVITLAAITSVYYEKTDHTGWASTAAHTMTSGGAVTDEICIVGYDATHYAIMNQSGMTTN